MDLPSGAPARGRSCGGSFVIHSSRPASSSGGFGPFRISSSVGSGVPCNRRHSARSRSPASHSSNPSIFFFSSRAASMAARCVGSRSDWCAFLTTLKASAAFGCSHLSGWTINDIRQYVFFSTAFVASVGGTPRTSYASLAGSASAARALSAAAIFASIPVSSTSSTISGGAGPTDSDAHRAASNAAASSIALGGTIGPSTRLPVLGSVPGGLS
mmetsp:Transcript_7367/g.33278  ORF Transcript_7367/g.33278 Transcript_7367/m.33278 type:complete len:214 (+) Transcript_7367:616-1257(+)